MANGTSTGPGLAFPRETFAKLTPGPFLHAHLKQKPSVRPSGRGLEEFRNPTINTGSLSHSSGSAVVRLGDTSVVCGIRAEILLASDIPHPPSDAETEADDDLVERLGLLVPNVELSTGCSPNHLPGNPPGTQAQALSYHVLSLLNSSRIIGSDSLRLNYTEPASDDDIPDAGPKVVAKGYWALYIDVLCIALDGNPFDAIWMAVMAALHDTKLPKAWWDPDNEIIVCSPLARDGQVLKLQGTPIASTFIAFSTDTPLKQRTEAESWVLADPDGFEESVCGELLTVVVRSKGTRGDVLSIEKHGGGVVNREALERCVELARGQRDHCHSILFGRRRLGT